MALHAGVVVLATFFGAWKGGLVGVSTENKKLKPFRDDIEAGKYLFLIYARKGMGEAIKAMMRKKHPESEHVATDRHFVNPFGDLRRKDHSAHPMSVKSPGEDLRRSGRKLPAAFSWPAGRGFSGPRSINGVNPYESPGFEVFPSIPSIEMIA